MSTSHNPRRTRAAIIAILVLALTAAVCIIVYRGKDEPLRYEGVTDVTLHLVCPPFSTFSLSNAEANRLLDELSATNFSKIEPEVRAGDGIRCTIATNTENYTITFIRPYCGTNGNLYILDDDAEVFNIVEQLVEDHL